MSRGIDVKYTELQTNSFFRDALEKLDEAEKQVSGYPDCHKLRGNTVLQGLIGHKSIIDSSLSDQKDAVDLKNFLLLYKNTSEFLNNIGVAFADIDGKIATKIETIET